MIPLPSPMPTAADRAEAERLLPELFPGVDPVWLANNHPRLVRYAADAVMSKRLNEEHRKAIAQAIGGNKRSRAA